MGFNSGFKGLIPTDSSV